MTEHNHEELRRLFDLTIAAPAQEREALLDRECGDDAGLIRRIKAMVAAAEDDGFLGTPTSDALSPIEDEGASPGNAATLAASPHETVGQQIGRYKLLQLVGEGGFGAVYMAEQREPVKRKVALKIIKLGMDTKQVIARFEAERQALAMMDHPNIAKVFDAGATETGRPYFVMELVKGVSITEHCDRQRLNIQERLELFMQVCEAVQHAHQKAIIHRDLKPTNILVSLREGEPLVKVIDFGIAKAISHRLTEKTIYTEQGQLIGTPEYMSPEQAEMTAQDIDTRSDIYSLGVLLYELLTGALPFDPTALRQAAFGEIQRVIREQEPPKPSTRLSSLGDESTTYAQMRRANPRSLLRELRGDLDWITMKALEKDRSRRYVTASELATDIKRHLTDEPVIAGPPSATYLARKFLCRHKVGVTAGVAVTVALVAGIVGTTTMAVFAAQERQVVLATRLGYEVTESLVTELSRQIADDGRRNTVGKLVDLAREVEATSLPGEPKAALHHQLGHALHHLDRHDEAVNEYRKSFELRRDVLGDGHLTTLETQRDLGSALGRLRELDEAQTVLHETVKLSRRKLGERHPQTLKAMLSLAVTLIHAGKLEETLALMDEVLVICRVSGRVDGSTRIAIFVMYAYLDSQGAAAAAEPLLRAVVQIDRDSLRAEDNDSLRSKCLLAELLYDLGETAEAEALFRQAVATGHRVLREGDPSLGTFLRGHGLCLSTMEQYDEAEAALLEAYSLLSAVGPKKARTINVARALANLYDAWGKPAKAAQWRAKLPEVESASEQDE